MSAYAAGRLPWVDGMDLADYLDAVGLMSATGRTISVAAWLAADEEQTPDDLLGPM